MTSIPEGDIGIDVHTVDRISFDKIVKQEEYDHNDVDRAHKLRNLNREETERTCAEDYNILTGD